MPAKDELAAEGRRKRKSCVLTGMARVVYMAAEAAAGVEQRVIEGGAMRISQCFSPLLWI